MKTIYLGCFCPFKNQNSMHTAYWTSFFPILDIICRNKNAIPHSFFISSLIDKIIEYKQNYITLYIVIQTD
jgi:hypothetical protein